MTELTQEEQIALRNYVHSPAEAADSVLDEAKSIYGSRGVMTGIPWLDNNILPNRAGQIRTWLAGPAQGKSTMLRLIALKEAQYLMSKGIKDRYVAFITYEETVESTQVVLMNSEHRTYTAQDFWRGKVKPEMVEAEQVKWTLPIWLFGNSLYKTTASTPAMTITMALDGMRAIWKAQNMKPHVVIIDYVQEIEVGSDTPNRTQAIIEALRDVIHLAQVLKCPIELGAQAKQTVFDKDPPIPEARDGEYSNFITQKSSQILGIWRPWTTHKDKRDEDGEALSSIGLLRSNGSTVHYKFEPSLTIIKPRKDRRGLLGDAVAVNLDVDPLGIRKPTPVKSTEREF